MGAHEQMRRWRDTGNVSGQGTWGDMSSWGVMEGHKEYGATQEGHGEMWGDRSRWGHGRR